MRAAKPKSLVEDTGGSAVHKAFSALEVIAGSDETLTLSEITARLGVPKASVHRLLAQLEQKGLLRRDLTGKRYLVGERIARLAYATLRSSARSSHRVILRSLVDGIGETCNLGVRDGTEILYIDRVECEWPLRSHFAAGSRVALHCTSIGKLSLALCQQQERDQLLQTLNWRRFTSNTITSRAALLPKLDRIRADGFAQNDQEFMEGVIGIAVPVMDANGRMLAGLSLHAPSARLTVRQARVHIPAMVKAAKRLAALVA